MIQTWTQYIQEGRQYLTTVKNGRSRKNVFNNELLCNLVGLSVEKLLVGLCMQRGHLPADHTLTGIVKEVIRHCPMEPALSDAIQMMDHIENLCSLEIGAPLRVNDKQINRMITMNEQVAHFVERNLQTGPADCAAAT